MRKVCSISIPAVLVSAMLSLLSVNVYAASPDAGFERHYAGLLKQYWRPPLAVNGVETAVFDYPAMHREHKRAGHFKSALKALEQIDVNRFSDRNSEMAFWINAYNFAAMKLVLDQYPVDSIRSIKINLFKYPWSVEAVRINGREYTLNQIEKDILLPRYKDPRIVFAVSCAAVSCPDRITEPFTADQLDQQLDQMIRQFYKNPDKGMRLDREKKIVYLSWILKQDRGLFGEYERGALGFVLNYLDEPVREWIEQNDVKVEYMPHDWTLNDVAQADSMQADRGRHD